MVLSSGALREAAKSFFVGYNTESAEVAVSFLVSPEITHNRATLVVVADDAGHTEGFNEILELAKKHCVHVVTLATMKEVGELVGSGPQVAVSLSLRETYAATVTNTLNQAVDTEDEARER